MIDVMTLAELYVIGFGAIFGTMFAAVLGAGALRYVFRTFAGTPDAQVESREETKRIVEVEQGNK